MFKKIIDFFRKKVKEEQTHKGEAALRDKVNAHIHRMFYSINNHHSFIGISVTGEGGEKIEGIVCYVKECNVEIGILTKDGEATIVNLMKNEYTVTWGVSPDPIFYSNENWIEYAAWCDRIFELDAAAGLALFAVHNGGSITEIPFFWPCHTNVNYTSSPMKGVYVLGYNVHTLHTLEELKEIYSRIQLKSLASVKDWYNSRMARDAAYMNSMIMEGDLVKHKNQEKDNPTLAVIKTVGTLRVSGGVVYDRIALNLKTDEFKLIASYNYRKVGRIDDLG